MPAGLGEERQYPPLIDNQHILASFDANLSQYLRCWYLFFLYVLVKFVHSTRGVYNEEKWIPIGFPTFLHVVDWGDQPGRGAYIEDNEGV